MSLPRILGPVLIIPAAAFFLMGYAMTGEKCIELRRTFLKRGREVIAKRKTQRGSAEEVRDKTALKDIKHLWRKCEKGWETDRDIEALTSVVGSTGLALVREVFVETTQPIRVTVATVGAEIGRIIQDALKPKEVETVKEPKPA